MIKRLLGPGILVIAWLGLWLGNVGVLVFSAASKIPTARDCTYFIGITVVKKTELLSDRCPLVRKV